MAALGTQTGFWIDWTEGLVYGSSITLTSRNSNIVIAIASLWVGNLLASLVWGTVATIIYSLRSSTKSRDGIHVQHQLIWRNSGDPLTAALENLDVYRHRSRLIKWLKQQITSSQRWIPRKSSSAGESILEGPTSKFSSLPKFDRIHRRSLLAISTPFTLWAAFFIAGVFVSYIATPNRNVLATNNLALCGVWNIAAANRPEVNPKDAQLQVENARSIKILNDTVNGRNYARSCYANDLGNLNPVSCSSYTKQSLQTFFAEDTYSCPFRSFPDEPFAGGACDAPFSKGAFAMWTGRLDSSADLGINAPEKNAIGFEKRVNCSVLSLSNRTTPISSTRVGFNFEPNVSFTGYLFGGSKDYVGNNITYFADVAASQSNGYGYQVTAVYSYAGVPGQDWTPATPFDVQDGDVSLFFFATNSICYLEKVYDPYFLATDPYQVPVGFSKPLNCYAPVNPVAVMGCVDQYSVCDSSRADARCTEPGGLATLGSKTESLRLNLYQHVTALRIVAMFEHTNTYYSVYGAGTAALKASDKVFDVLSSGLPSNQWKIEVLGWFQTSLAKMQSYAVEFVSNTADLGPFGNVSFPGYNSSTLPIWQQQCRSQRIANPGQCQVFSFLGTMILVCFGIFAFSVKRMTKYCMGRRQIANEIYLADDKFQLQRMVLDAPVLSSENGYPVYDPAFTHIGLRNSTTGGSGTYFAHQSATNQPMAHPHTPTTAAQSVGQTGSTTGGLSASQTSAIAYQGPCAHQPSASSQISAAAIQSTMLHSTRSQTGSPRPSQP